ncbi:MAG: tRNA-wybutosine modification methyltransferase TYW3 [Nitrososphaeria archaeon]
MTELREKWEKRKISFYKRMEKDIVSGYFDKKMIPVIKTLFKLKDAYPTSSCSGRILILASRVPWRKRNVKIMFKFHEINDQIKQDILEKVLALEDENLWLFVQPPIVHVSCYNIDTAIKLVKVARNTGFKESKIFMESPMGSHLELKGKELLIVPIRLEKTFLFEKEKLKLVFDEASRILEDFKEKISKLQNEIEKALETKLFETDTKFEK